jgi:hypothetical protein
MNKAIMSKNSVSLSIMECLPAEILHLICTFLPVTDLSSFRLSCRDCSALGESHSFRQLHVMFLAKSFHNLQQISQHPHLSRHVSSIIYEQKLLEDVDQQEYELSIFDNNSSGEEEQVLALKAEAGWANYKTLLEEQEYMERINYDFSTFAQVFTRFPILKSLELWSGYEGPYSETLARAYESTLAIPGLMLGGVGTRDDDEVGVRGMRSILIAASGMTKRLESLRAHKVSWSFFNPTPKNLLFSRNAFAYLRYLELQLEADYDNIDEEEAVKAQQIELGQVLCLATGLESLTLRFEHESMGPDSFILQRQVNVPVLWERIFQSAGTWHHLRRLELNHITTSELHLIAFLNRHSKCLKSIIWTNMWLLDGTAGWTKIFKKMKRDMKFETVEFGGFWGGGDSMHGRQKLIKMEDVGPRLAKTILRGPEKRGKKTRKGLFRVAQDPLFEILDPGEF